MALRAVPDHPKFAELKNFLKIPKGAALGWLECIWHFTGRFTPHGNIGKYTDTAIESWVEWDGESGQLIEGLTRAGWLDRDDDHRLVVHDWHMHADKATKLSVKRSNIPFCKNGMTRTPQCGHTVAEVGTVYGLPVPVPVPVPVPDSASAVVSLPAWLPLEPWSAFLEMRKKKRAVPTTFAVELLLRELDNHRIDGHDPTLVIEQSIRNNWTDFFPLRAASTSQRTKKREPGVQEAPAKPEDHGGVAPKHVLEQFRREKLAEKAGRIPPRAASP